MAGASNGKFTDYRLLVAVCGLLAACTGGAFTIATNLALSRFGAIEEQVGEGILPRAEERIRSLERRVETLEAESRRHVIEDH